MTKKITPKVGTPAGYKAGLSGQKTRSQGQGRGLGTGQGNGPIRRSQRKGSRGRNR